MDDIFDDNSKIDEELLFSGRDYERHLETIENSVFLDSFEPAPEEIAKENVDIPDDIETLFTNQYSNELSILDSFINFLLRNVAKEEERKRAIILKSKLQNIQRQLKREQLKNKHSNDEGQVKYEPSQKIIEEFNSIKRNILRIETTVTIPNKFKDALNDLKI